jgi:hypothetical protein
MKKKVRNRNAMTPPFHPISARVISRAAHGALAK